MRDMLPAGWAPVAVSRSIRKAGVLPVSAFGLRLALWKGASGEVGGIVDSCPHRGAAFSKGAVIGENVACPYHGWEYDREGVCRKRPRVGWTDDCGGKVRRVSVQEDLGLVWVNPGQSTPLALGSMMPAGCDVVYSFQDDIPIHWYYVVENLMDVTHFPSVHSSSFSDLMFGDFAVAPTYNEGLGTYVCEYSVRLEPRGAFEKLVGRVALCHVRAAYIAPYIQLFEVRYDNGLRYGNVQAVCPMSEGRSRMFMVGFADRAFDVGFGKRMETADREIWGEDKRVIETVNIPFVGVRALPIRTEGVEIGDLNRIYINRALRGLVDLF